MMFRSLERSSHLIVLHCFHCSKEASDLLNFKNVINLNENTVYLLKGC